MYLNISSESLVSILLGTLTTIALELGSLPSMQKKQWSLGKGMFLWVFQLDHPNYPGQRLYAEPILWDRVGDVSIV